MPPANRPRIQPWILVMLVLACTLTPALAASPDDLDFLLGEWKLDTWFAGEGGTRQQGVAYLSVTRTLGGTGIQILSRYPGENGAPPFRATTTYVLNPRLDRWVGSGINTLGNAKQYDAERREGTLIATQSGMLFRGRQGQNRVTYFDIGPDGFKLRHEHSPDDGETWQPPGFGYTATRVKK